MFKAKVYLYKNINGTEVKVEKKFDDQHKFDKYLENNPDLKKMEKNFTHLHYPESFSQMQDFLSDFDKRMFCQKDKKSFFNDMSLEFKKLFYKSKRHFHK